MVLRVLWHYSTEESWVNSILQQRGFRRRRFRQFDTV
uniref:Uncharacterized protein n=1 Tax=Cucumis melo TaxID=3656 RepID=A0A9I9E2X4_CUCME